MNVRLKVCKVLINNTLQKELITHDSQPMMKDEIIAQWRWDMKRFVLVLVLLLGLFFCISTAKADDWGHNEHQDCYLSTFCIIYETIWGE